MAQNKFSGQLYQLTSRHALSPGAYVGINGPYDSFGVVRQSGRKEDGQYLNLIRGVPARPAEKPVAQF